MAQQEYKIQIDPENDLNVSLSTYSDSAADTEKRMAAELTIKLLKNIQRSQRANVIPNGQYRTTLNGVVYRVDITKPITFLDPLNSNKEDQENLTLFLNAHKNKKLLSNWSAHSQNDIEKNRFYITENAGTAYYFFLTRPINLMVDQYHAEGKTLGKGAYGEVRPSYQLMFNEFSKLYHPRKTADVVSKTITIPL